MSEPPDYETLARRYLDLWQEQVSLMAADPQMADAMGRWFTMMMGGASWLAAPLTPPGAGADLGGGDGQRTGSGGAASRAAAAGAASDGGGGDLARLERRLADVEKRLAALEAGARRGAARSRGKPRKG